MGETGSESAPAKDARLKSELEAIRRAFDLPGVAGGFVTASGEIVVAATGVRSVDSSEPLMPTDLLHLGSVTKPITATLAAVLVEKGTIRWKSTVGELLGDRLETLHPAHRETTLDQLLRHRAGLQGFEEDEEFEAVPAFFGTAPEKRRQFVEWLLARPPQVEGRGHHYSNAGYSVAALLLEVAAGRSWEELLATELAGPLGIDNLDFGWPSESEAPGAHGHRFVGGRFAVHEPDEDAYRLEDLYIDPAGDLSMDIGGLAKFARLHLLGLEGTDGLLPARAVSYLHTPLDGDDYSLGWYSYPTRSSHLGSAGTGFAAIYVMKERRVAMVVAVNAWSEAEEEFAAALLKAILDLATDPRSGS